MSHPNLIVLAQSPAWCSLVERRFQSANLSWVLNFESLAEEAAQSRGAAAIVELRPKSLFEDCVQAASLANNPFQVKLFAVAEFELQPWLPLLAAAGFSAWFDSLMQAPGLELCISKHLASIRATPQSLETRIWSELPWPSATSGRDA